MCDNQTHSQAYAKFIGLAMSKCRIDQVKFNFYDHLSEYHAKFDRTFCLRHFKFHMMV